MSWTQQYEIDNVLRKAWEKQKASAEKIAKSYRGCDARKARDEAIKKVGDASPDWLEIACSAIEAVSLGATTKHHFTSDDVLRYDSRLERCPEKRVIGAAFNKLCKAKVIEKTKRYVASSRRISHGRRKCEWRRCHDAGM